MDDVAGEVYAAEEDSLWRTQYYRTGRDRIGRWA